MDKEKETLSEEKLYRLSEFYKVFANETRIRILYQLMEKEACVGELAHVLNMSQSAISHQLQIIKGSRLVRMKKDGKSAVYSLADHHVKSVLLQGREHVDGQFKNRGKL